MRSYNRENLQQCVRNLFAQARYEFKAIHNIECKFKIAVGEGMTKSKVFSLWDNDGDCFYATALSCLRYCWWTASSMTCGYYLRLLSLNSIGVEGPHYTCYILW